MHVCFPFHVIAKWEVLALDAFLNCLCNQFAEKGSHIYSSQHVENGRERNCVIRVYSFRNYILIF